MSVGLSFLPVPADDIRLPPFVQLLEPALSVDVIKQRLAEMDEQGSICMGVFRGESLVGIGSYSLRTHCFSGRVMFVENVVFDAASRGAGYGEQLMARLERIAIESDCYMVTLDAYARNVRARSFYQRLGYDPRGVHFVKEL